MVKFVVSFVDVALDLSISEMDLLGKENGAEFSGFQNELGGDR